jgi:CRP/FNR family transcriptional regulator
MINKSHKTVSCSTCGARKSSFFGGFCDHEVELANEAKTCTFYKKNQPLFVEGNYPRGVYCINQGKVKIFTRGDEGREQIIHIAKEGEIIGFRSMLSEEPYKVSALTLEECNICFIVKDDFLTMMENNPGLRNGIIKDMSKELGDRALFITNMAQKSVRERLAFSLLLLQEIYGEEQINLTREDLANFVGIATETLIRLLKDFKEEGVLEIHTRKLELKDKIKLLRISGK